MKDIVDKILNTYPTPIAHICNRVFIRETEKPEKSLVQAFDLLWAFLSIIVLADYLRLNSPSKKQNVLLVSSLRSMTVEKWIDTFRSMISYLGQDPFIPELIYYFRTSIAPDDKSLSRFTRFKKRIAIDFVPVDNYEIMENKNCFLRMLEELSFLSNYSLVMVTGEGTFVLKGMSGKKEIDPFPGTKPGEVGLLNADSSSFLSLSPFIKVPEGSSTIAFTNFYKEKMEYMKFVQSPSMLPYFKEYKNIIAGNPDFSEIQSKFPVNPSFMGVREKLTEILSADKQKRILIEGHPGSGKTMLVSRIENFIYSSEYIIFKYFPQESHLLSSAAIFSRFLYIKLNSILEKPYPVSFKGQEWKNFQKKVMDDFRQSGKKVIIVIDSIDIVKQEHPDEKSSLYMFLQLDFPDNLLFIFTTRIGDYPVRFDVKIRIPEFQLAEAGLILEDMKVDQGELLKAYNFYEGSRGYIFHSITDQSEGFGGFPSSIRQRFVDLLFTYRLFHPVKEKICYYLARSTGSRSLGEIAHNLEVYAPVVIKHIEEMKPVLKMEKDEHQVLYRLFVPAFAIYMKKLEKPSKKRR